MPVRFTCLALALVALPFEAQQTRPPQLISNPDPVIEGVSIATADDLSAIVFTEHGFPFQVLVSTSDGRGLEWTTPVRADDATQPDIRQTGARGRSTTRNLHVAGDSIFVPYRDTRFNPLGDGELFFTRSTDRGVTWEPSRRLNSVAPAGSQIMGYFIMEASDASIHILYSTSTQSISIETLRLVTSNDMGASFSSPIQVTSAQSSVDVDMIDMAVQGNSIYCAWNDDRNGSPLHDDIYINVSFDGGQSFVGDQKLNSSPVLVGDVEDLVSVAVSGSTVFVTWVESFDNSGIKQIRGAVSTDGGVNFGPDVLIQQGGTGVPLVQSKWTEIVGGNLVVVTRDRRTGNYQNTVTTSTDLGATWTETLLTGSGFDPMLVYDENDPSNETLAVVTRGSLTADQTSFSFSRDAGVTWEPVFGLDDGFDRVDEGKAAWNTRYGNFLSASIVEPFPFSQDHVSAGGLRPQTASITSRLSGSTTRFDLTHWEPGQPRFVWVLGSNSPGDFPLPFGDLRNLGLMPDGVLLATLNDPATFLTSVDSTGTGSTASFALAVPAGSSFYSAAVSFELGPLALAEVSDVVRIDVQ